MLKNPEPYPSHGLKSFHPLPPLPVLISGSGPSLLRPISEPICRYLRSRPDTIKCLVAMITQQDQDGEGDDREEAGHGGAAGALMEELRKVGRGVSNTKCVN